MHDGWIDQCPCPVCRALDEATELRERVLTEIRDRCEADITDSNSDTDTLISELREMLARLVKAQRIYERARATWYALDNSDGDK